ncbi:hypothetical protein D3C75_381160 [compost metagenome]
MNTDIVNAKRIYFGSTAGNILNVDQVNQDLASGFFSFLYSAFNGGIVRYAKHRYDISTCFCRLHYLIAASVHNFQVSKHSQRRKSFLDRFYRMQPFVNDDWSTDFNHINKFSNLRDDFLGSGDINKIKC